MIMETTKRTRFSPEVAKMAVEAYKPKMGPLRLIAAASGNIILTAEKIKVQEKAEKEERRKKRLAAQEKKTACIGKQKATM
ncbi:hypothetical protein EMCRGX_G020310 [Ephydatia muelleri]|eukprot:Em0016g233a